MDERSKIIDEELLLAKGMGSNLSNINSSIVNPVFKSASKTPQNMF